MTNPAGGNNVYLQLVHFCFTRKKNRCVSRKTELGKRVGFCDP